MQVRAAVFVSPGQPLELRTLDRGELRPGEVFVRVEACTLCGSDLHSYHGRRSSPTPGILGHEIIGTVEAMHGDVAALDGSPLQIGDRVTWCLTVGCGRCFFCTHDLPQKCEKVFKYGHESLDSAVPLSGGLAEGCRLAAGTMIVKLPADLSAAVASPAMCATATVAAVLRAAAGVEGKTVLVQGLGMLGLTACAMLRQAGAARVIGTDPDARRAETGGRFGADVVLPADNAALATAVRGLTEGRGVDAAFEFSGSRAAVAAALPLLRTGATYVVAGTVTPGSAVAIDPRELVTRMLTLRGVHNYQPRDLSGAIAFLAANAHLFPFEEMVGLTVPLDHADEAFHIPLADRPPRVMVRPAMG